MHVSDIMGPALHAWDNSMCRAMKHELRHPAYLCEQLDKGNVCPACPKVSMISCGVTLLEMFFLTYCNALLIKFISVVGVREACTIF